MRLPWWLWRLERGGRTLAPGPRELQLAYVDSRDLAIFVLDGVERGLGGIFNTISQPGHTTMEELLEVAKDVVRADAELVWKSPEEILAAGIGPWRELPIWISPGGNQNLTYQGDASKAYNAGLRVRPTADTVKDTWQWLLSGEDVPAKENLQVGLDPEKEARFLGDGEK